MFPSMGGIDPKQMNGMLRQMGVKTEDLAAEKVTINLKDGSIIVVTSPSITQIDFKGQISFQVVGNVSKATGNVENEENEDIKLIMMQTNSTEKMAKEALVQSGGDLATAIMKLKNKE